MMKKLFVILFLMMMLTSILLVPTQIASAEVIVTEVSITGTITGALPCERDWTEGGVTHWRNCVVYFLYDSNDDRLDGPCEMTMHRNIFSEIGYPAVGHGSWVLDAVNVEGGYWAGTFTANIDETGYMSVYIRGKGFGTLEGLFYETTTHSVGGTDTAYIKTLPSYDGP
jgi:hypothetical protein